jgi:hypothetical protein
VGLWAQVWRHQTDPTLRQARAPRRSPATSPSVTQSPADVDLAMADELPVGQALAATTRLAVPHELWSETLDEPSHENAAYLPP